MLVSRIYCILDFYYEPLQISLLKEIVNMLF